MSSRNARMWVPVLIVALAVGGIVAVVALSGGSEEASAQTVRFQKPTEVGPNPFTRPADVRGKRRVPVGSGPFGGSGSDLVCDREKLIRSLRARPSRQREWARVRGISPSNRSVARYIRSLRPVTLTRDTRVTNHTFEGGRAVPFQAILQAGTAVLVDKNGVPVARCRCGNPLTPAQFIPEAQCISCPANYTPPPPCSPPSRCFRRYPDPPPVIVVVARERPAPTTTNPPPATTPEPEPEPPPPQQAPDESPSSRFSPQVGVRGDSFTLFASGYAPSSTLRVTLTRPDGHVENYTIQTGVDGSGQHNFSATGPDTITGTYTAVTTNPDTGASSTATTELRP